MTKKICDNNIIALYLHSQTEKGKLAQLVQSTSFTPRGSGVRTPHFPQTAFHLGFEKDYYTKRPLEYPKKGN